MKVKGLRWVCAIAVVAAATQCSFANETEMLVNSLAEKGIITYGEARRILTEGKEDARNAVARGEADTLPLWVQNISLKGDLRLRHQADWDSSKNYARVRERLRLRLGFDTRIADGLKAGFGIATGSEQTSGTSVIDAEPTSTNHTFQNGFAKAMLMVDYAFLEYNPFAWVKVTGGKMKAGTEAWEPCDLLWDTDINPDGLAVAFTRDISSSLNCFINGSWLILNDLNTNANNPDVYIAQPGVVFKASDNINVKAAVAYEQFNVNKKNTGYYGTPAFDYRCTIPAVELSYKEIVGPYTLSLFGESVSNGDSKPAKDKNGLCYGMRFGHEKIGGFGQWQAVALSRRLESNAWLNKLGDSDAYGGANNAEGYELIGTVGLTKSATLGIDYYNMHTITGTSVPKSLIQFDVVYKF